MRLMRFLARRANTAAVAAPAFDKSFMGPITKQIRAARTFFQESSFFKRYQRRKPEGGFAEEPELPPIAIDEAIVNAVAHREYQVKSSIECEHYTDAFDGQKSRPAASAERRLAEPVLPRGHCSRLNAPEQEVARVAPADAGLGRP